MADRGTVEILILGPVETRVGGERVPVPGAKQRNLLARLLIARGRPVSRFAPIHAPESLSRQLRKLTDTGVISQQEQGRITITDVTALTALSTLSKRD